VTDLAAAAIRRLAGRLRSGTLVVDGVGGPWTAGSGEPVIRLTVRDARFYLALLRRGSEGLGESYAAGWWATDDLTGLVRLLLTNLATPMAALDMLGSVASRPLSAIGRRRPPSKEADRANVQAHYDLPEELFSSMLDETMTYSCAIFEKPDDSLLDGQLAKLDRICRKLELGPRDHVVEIGTGWGGFALRAAGTYGCRVTTTTVSAQQYETATRRVAEAGLSDRVEVLSLDYRDLEGRYDKLVSIEMIEAVGWRDFDTFFTRCSSLLAKDGSMLLQAIVIDDRAYAVEKASRSFIRTHIFPNGCLPSLEVIARCLARHTDLRTVGLKDLTPHYAETLRRWRANFAAAGTRLEDLGYDERFRRLWRMYLAYCEAGFAERRIGVVQIHLVKPQWREYAGPTKAGEAPLALAS